MSVSPGHFRNRFKPVRIRVEFSKTGILRYLSHLELMILLQRAIKRAGFPIEYSKGFHPAPDISFGPPLGVGISGLSEYFDMKVTPPFDLVRNRDLLNGLLPEGVAIEHMSAIPANAESLNSFITCYEYEVKGGDLSGFRSFMSEKEVLAKREKYDINLREMFEDGEITGEDTVSILLADRGDRKVRLGEILPVVFNRPVEELCVTRTGLFGWENGWVKPLNTCKMQLVNCKV
jgi:radical SAM-linked protein